MSKLPGGSSLSATARQTRVVSLLAWQQDTGGSRMEIIPPPSGTRDQLSIDGGSQARPPLPGPQGRQRFEIPPCSIDHSELRISTGLRTRVRDHPEKPKLLALAPSLSAVYGSARLLRRP